MGPATWSEAVDPPAAPAVRDGVVSRPGLFELLVAAGRVTEVSAPAGSGKTLLVRSWIGESGLAERAAWVPVQGDERDPQPFWLSVLGALRDTAAGSKLVRPLTAAPGLDGWAVVERLLTDLGGLEDRIWLVIDDVHELRSAEALRQLELLLMRAPAGLRFVLATRHDLRLGLHRLRLEGELTEIRAADLRFTPGGGAGAVRGGRDSVVRFGGRVVVRADRGLGGGAATGGAVAPAWPAVSGGHWPGVLGAAGELAVVPAGSAVEHAGDRAGRPAWLDGGAGRWRRLPGAGCGHGRPGAARGGGAVTRTRRAHRPGRGRAGSRDEAALRPRDDRARAWPVPRGAGRHPDGRAAGHVARHGAHAGQAGEITPAAGARADGRNAPRRARPGRDGRGGARQRRDTHRRGGAAARPGRSGSGDRRAGARHRGVRSVDERPPLGRSGVPARRDRPRRPRRRGRRQAGPRARPR